MLKCASWKLLWLVTMVCGADSARALTAKEALDICTTNETACNAYVAGHVDLYFELMGLGLISNDALCWPQGATYSQGRLIFVKWAQGNPADLHLPAGLMMNVAFLAAFPCATTTQAPPPSPKSRSRGF